MGWKDFSSWASVTFTYKFGLPESVNIKGFWRELTQLEREQMCRGIIPLSLDKTLPVRAECEIIEESDYGELCKL